jgi:hypothetical protein
MHPKRKLRLQTFAERADFSARWANRTMRRVSRGKLSGADSARACRCDPVAAALFLAARTNRDEHAAAQRIRLYAEA